jgi:hypothetical protein
MERSFTDVPKGIPKIKKNFTRAQFLDFIKRYALIGREWPPETKTESMEKVGI